MHVADLYLVRARAAYWWTNLRASSVFVWWMLTLKADRFRRLNKACSRKTRCGEVEVLLRLWFRRMSTWVGLYLRESYDSTSESHPENVSKVVCREEIYPGTGSYMRMIDQSYDDVYCVWMSEDCTLSRRRSTLRDTVENPGLV